MSISRQTNKEVVMLVCELGFFSPKKSENKDLFALNIKNFNLRSQYYAYLLQQLEFLTRRDLAKRAKKKQNRLQSIARKRRAKKRLILQNPVRTPSLSLR